MQAGRVREADPPTERFWRHVDRGGGCWLWSGAMHSQGYGSFYVEPRMVFAHRFAWELLRGPIPSGMHIDHRCHVRNCVNPSHLQVVTPKQNVENFTGLNRNNTSGVRGVSWNKDKQRWQAAVTHNGRHHRKRFLEIEDAEAWVVDMRIRLFTNNLLDRGLA